MKKYLKIRRVPGLTVRLLSASLLLPSRMGTSAAGCRLDVGEDKYWRRSGAPDNAYYIQGWQNPWRDAAR
jgi:hypothetical protein